MTGIHHQILQLSFKSIIRLLIGKEKLRIYESTNWEKEGIRFCNPELSYPQYYSSQNFHGIENGYLNPIAAITYDLVTAFASPPNETWVRQQLIAVIESKPLLILDLGCGTASTTLMLKQAYPQATTIGLDLSTHMLVLAEHKARKAKLDINFLHGLAESTGLESNTFDLVTVSFLLHETPPNISQLILQECFRLLKPGGEAIVLDGNQKILRHTDWLIELFREPYSKVYASGSVDDWMQTAGFDSVQTEYIGWIQQVTRGVKLVSNE